MNEDIILLDKWLCKMADECLDAIPDHDDNRRYTRKDKMNIDRAGAFIQTELKVREILMERKNRSDSEGK